VPATDTEEPVIKLADPVASDFIRNVHPEPTEVAPETVSPARASMVNILRVDKESEVAVV